MPKGFRPLGIALLVTGIVLSVLKYYFNLKPDVLELKVFAFYSFYIESKKFSMITHQMLGEIAGLLLLGGLFLIAFTKEKEESEFIDRLRLKAFLFAGYLNLFYLIISILFFFGFGFVGALTLFSVVWLATYLVIFRITLMRSKRVA
jgi:hypothetical protein